MNKQLKYFFGKISFILIVVFAFVNVSMGQQMINMSTANCTISANEVQMDILVTNTGKVDLRWNGCVVRMNVPPALIPSGQQTYTLNYLGGTDFPLSFPAAGNNSPGAGFNAAKNILTWVSSSNIVYSNEGCKAPLIAAGQTKKIGRFSFKMTGAEFAKGAAADFIWHTTSSCILYENCDSKTTGFGKTDNRILTDPCTLTVPGN